MTTLYLTRLSLLLLVAGLASACSAPTVKQEPDKIPTEEVSPTVAPVPVKTQTPPPTITPAPSLAPTYEFPPTVKPVLVAIQKDTVEAVDNNPVLVGTQVPWPDEAITVQNARQLTELARWDKLPGWPESKSPPVSSLAYSPVGDLIAAGLANGKIKLLDATNGQELRILTGRESWVGSLEFSPDGTLLASEATDEMARLWEVASGKELFSTQGVNDFGWGVGGVPAVGFSSDGKLLAIGGPNGQVKIWDAISHVEVLSLDKPIDDFPTGQVSAVAFSPDGKIFATGYAKPNFGVTPGVMHLIVLWDPLSGQELRTLEYSPDDTIPNISNLEFSPDGKILAAGYFEGKIILWDVASGRELYTLSDPWEGQITSLSFSSGGDVLAICSDWGQFMLFDVANGEQLASLAIPTNSLTFSPDGKLLISGSDFGIHLWGIAP